ncbi:hypothetical protein [uncultured Nitratireductor sp.]|uniref:hypothetical protein n=1 Tax=uncultured Nitratireductor sp. TaxID=520953 RepID=UPI0025F0E645|nr:hypothetical protein [uncultured Nitratireductor sp.]
MGMLIRMIVGGLLIGLAGTTVAAAQTAAEMNETLDEIFGDHAPYRAFFEKLKKAVADNDRKTVASLVEYPFKARINDKSVTIGDAAHFTADYDKVFTDTVKKAVNNQTYPKLFANWQGVMVGDGEVWFNGICGDDSCSQQTVRIIAVND